LAEKLITAKNELVRDKRKYEDLLERADTIRNHKKALETRLRAFGNAVARSEAAYKATVPHWGRLVMMPFIQVDGSDQYSVPWQNTRICFNLNRNSSLGLTQYGTTRPDGGSSTDQVRYNNRRDLQVTNKDTITSGDIATR
jgi:hypothetical protein